jgi:hypothetical protein
MQVRFLPWSLTPTGEAMLTFEVHLAAIPARVQAGIALLDEKLPHWREQLRSAGPIQMQSCFRCVLGRLFGEYIVGRDLVGLDAKQAEQRGFIAPLFIDGVVIANEQCDDYYARLNDEWLTQLSPALAPSLCDAGQ